MFARQVLAGGSLVLACFRPSRITVLHCDVCHAGCPDVLSVAARYAAQGATRQWGSAEVSRWEWFKIGLFGLLISLALTSATAAAGFAIWWIMK